jgi:hypothetical protein
MFEHKSEPLLSRWAFYVRMAQSGAVVAGIITFSLLVGSAGYHYLSDLPWIDSLLNASMILAGMGPVDPLTTASAKLFATFYALYSGVAFLTIMAVLMAPLLHRLLHKFHMEISEDEREGQDEAKPRK